MLKSATTDEEYKMGISSKTAVGIIGAGNLGQAFARLAIRGGRRAVISHRGGSQTLGPVVSGFGAGAPAGTVTAAAAERIVVLAVPWLDLPAALAGLVSEGHIVIDATNAVMATFEGGEPRFTPADLDSKTSSEVVQASMPGARVVKAGNTLRAEVLAADPREGSGNRVSFLSADDKPAKDEVASLFADAGFFPISLGSLRDGGRMQQMLTGPLVAMNLSKVA